MLERPGRAPLDLTTVASGLSWTTAAVGGFGSCSFTLTGDWRQRVRSLSFLRATYGASVLFEGLIEDVSLDVSDSNATTSVTGFGLRRRLEQTSVQQIWVTRDIGWQALSRLTGALGATNLIFSPDIVNSVTIGQYDDVDPTRHGIRIIGTAGAAAVAGDANGAWVPLPIAATKIYFDVQRVPGTSDGTITEHGIRDSLDGSNWNSLQADTNLGFNGPVSYAIGLSSGSRNIQLLLAYTAGATGANAGIDFYNIRLLGSAVDESEPGGIYGGQILRDLVSLVPDITAGVIEDGSDFAIDQMERSVRSNALSVVEELAVFYPREWGVWEDGRFDWETRNLDEPQWLLTVADVASLALTASVDNLVRTIYVDFVDAASLQSAEVSATSTSQRNPFVRTGRTKDAVVQVPFMMTNNTATKLAERLVADQGDFPIISGRVTIPATRQISCANGNPRPAFLLRGGDNIVITDLPTDDPFTPGRDGQTLFHVVSTDASDAGMVTLEIEAQRKASDILLARLAAVSRTVTG